MNSDQLINQLLFKTLNKKLSYYKNANMLLQDGETYTKFTFVSPGKVIDTGSQLMMPLDLGKFATNHYNTIEGKQTEGRRCCLGDVLEYRTSHLL